MLELALFAYSWGPGGVAYGESAFSPTEVSVF